MKVGEAYRLARDLVDCDVWVFQAALNRASRAGDALLRVAEMEERLGSAAAAEAALDRAIELDLYAEEPYRRLMALQARNCGTDSVHSTWRQLQHRLSDLDLDCEPATAVVYRSLTSGTDASGQP